MRAAGVMLLSLLVATGATAAGDDSPRTPSLHFFPEPLSSGGDSVAAGDVAADRETEATPAFDGGEPSPLARPPEEIRALIDRQLEAVAREAVENGSLSRRVIDELATLASLYQEADQHYAAVGALYTALEISRRLNGLYSLEHAPLLEGMIESVRALEDYGEAATLEDRLAEMAYRNLGDPRVTQILAASANRWLSETYRLLAEQGGFEVAFDVGVGPIPATGSALPGTARREALTSLWRARQLYVVAIAAGARNGQYAAADLLEIEEQMLTTYFLEMSHPGFEPPRGRGFRLHRGARMGLCESGEQVLKTRVENVAKFQSPVAAASALVQLADWRLLCAKNAQALDTYESAYAALLEREAVSGALADVLSPPVPPSLPSFYDEVIKDEAPHRYRGYVDVSFVVGRYGTTRSIEILGQSAGTPKHVERELKEYIARNRFRPRVVDGKPQRSSRVTVRYWYDY